MIEWLMIIHVMSAAVLFGAGLGTAFYMFYVNLQQDIQLIADATKQVVFADWLLTGTAGIVQFFTGIILIYLKGYAFSAFWIVTGMLGYLIAGACWIPVVYLQMRCRDLAFEAIKNNTGLPKKYYQYYKVWWILGIPAFISLLVVFYVMTNRPIACCIWF